MIGWCQSIKWTRWNMRSSSVVYVLIVKQAIMTFVEFMRNTREFSRTAFIEFENIARCLKFSFQRRARGRYGSIKRKIIQFTIWYILILIILCDFFFLIFAKCDHAKETQLLKLFVFFFSCKLNTRILNIKLKIFYLIAKEKKSK